MKRCPTCNARYKGKQVCHRCGMNIGSLIDIQQQAREHYHLAIKHYYDNNFDQMFFHARRTCSLYRNPESIKLLACAALMINHFEMAINLWQQFLHCEPLCSR